MNGSTLGDKIGRTGDVAVAGGYAMAPFTGGESLAAVRVGEKLQAGGTILSVANDFKHGDIKKAGEKTVAAGAEVIVSDKIEGLQKVGAISSMVKNILGAMTATTGKLIDIGIDKLNSEGGSSPKKIDVSHNSTMQRDHTNTRTPIQKGVWLQQ